MGSDDYQYYWDDNYQLNRKLISFDSYDDLENIKINGINAQELLNKQKIDFRLIDGRNTLSTGLYDKFGEILIEKNNEIVRKIRISPWKLSKKKGTPQEVYEFISNDIFSDINSFLSYVIKKLRKDIKSIDSFSYHLLDEFPKSYDFLINLLEYASRLLEDSLVQLFHSGPLHKDLTMKKDYSGSQLVLSSLVNPSPYHAYIKKQHTHDTVLNQMMFQASYYLMNASKLIEPRVEKKNRYLKQVTRSITLKTQKQLNEYHLWSFYNLEILDDSDIRSKLLSQNNPYYLQIYKVFRIVKDVIVYMALIAALHLEKGIEMGLKEFFTIYEIWSIAKIWETYQKNGFELQRVEIDSCNLISTKMVLILKKNNLNVKIFWEIHLDPYTHSTYYGGLIDSDKKDSNPIKPDVTIMIECMDYKKVFIGDVKFSMKKESPLPKLDSLYKVLSYLEDLKKSPLFKGAEVSGLLIYPGDMMATKTPLSENENNIYITPLNMFNDDFSNITCF
jgi:hypothetical protein